MKDKGSNRLFYSNASSEDPNYSLKYISGRNEISFLKSIFVFYIKNENIVDSDLTIYMLIKFFRHNNSILMAKINRLKARAAHQNEIKRKWK